MNTQMPEIGRDQRRQLVAGSPDCPAAT